MSRVENLHKLRSTFAAFNKHCKAILERKEVVDIWKCAGYERADLQEQLDGLEQQWGQEAVNT